MFLTFLIILGDFYPCWEKRKRQGQVYSYGWNRPTWGIGLFECRLFFTRHLDVISSDMFDSQKLCLKTLRINEIFTIFTIVYFQFWLLYKLTCAFLLQNLKTSKTIISFLLLVRWRPLFKWRSLEITTI